MDEPLFVLGDRPDWFDRARCMGVPLPVFYGEDRDQQEHGSHRPYLLPGDISRAKKLCAGCEVREQCLDWALERREEHGIWGGYTHKERARMLRVRAGQVDLADTLELVHTTAQEECA